MSTWMPALLASWSLTNLLGNANSWIQVTGGLLLVLMGTAGIIWAGARIWQRLVTPTKGSGAPVSLPKTLALLFVSGALAAGGWQLMSTVSSGGEQTIMDIGSASSL